MMGLWHHISHWLVSDLYTLEERALFAEQARRMKLRTDLQEQRIKAKDEARTAFRISGYWRCPHRWNDVEVNSVFTLEQSQTKRMVRASVVERKIDKKVLAKAEISDFIKARPDWLEVIKPWLDGGIATSDLPKLSKDMKLVGKLAHTIREVDE